MPNLKDIRRRIKSVKSTQKITLAMKMVAGAKVKRAENRVRANRPYAHQLRLTFRDVYEAMKNQHAELSGSRYADLLVDRPIKKVGIIAISSDRGLCGAYNSNVIRQALRVDKQYQAEGIEPKFFLVGNKMMRSFPRYSQSHILGKAGDITAAPSHHDANQIAQTLVQAFHNHEIDAIQILYTHFVSMLSYRVSLLPVLPLKGLIEEVQHLVLPEFSTASEYEPKAPAHVSPETLLEPNAVAVLDTLIPLYLGNQIYISMLESSASELAARMTAMSNASNNAAELIDKLTLDYNKARQASITQEILEIVGGAEALKG